MHSWPPWWSWTLPQGFPALATSSRWFWPFKVCHFDLPGLRYEPETAEKYKKIDGRPAVLPAVQSKKVANIKVAPPLKSPFCWLDDGQKEDQNEGKTRLEVNMVKLWLKQTAGPPSFFLYFSAVSGSYLGPGRSKWHTLKGQNHPLEVANAGKPWGRVQLHQGGQECIRKDNFFGKMALKRGTPIFDAS